ncbi:hypothetical protein B0H14DRAFT_2638745 [Mycena olivaceomarginata]|nr:hypothetical protein B0H14DRAFT_2638745 [Mycena olivaceomarginata]
MDATTVLGSKCVQLDLAVPGAQAVDPTYIFGCEVEMLVNEGESPKRAAQAQYQATPYAPWASQRIGTGWEQPRAREKGPMGRKKPQKRLRERSTRQHHMPPGQARG